MRGGRASQSQEPLEAVRLLRPKGERGGIVLPGRVGESEEKGEKERVNFYYAAVWNLEMTTYVPVKAADCFPWSSDRCYQGK